MLKFGFLMVRGYSVLIKKREMPHVSYLEGHIKVLKIKI